jgi:hypothetical protein
MQVGSILNFSLMYILAPTTGGVAATSQLSRIISGATLTAWGAPSIPPPPPLSFLLLAIHWLPLPVLSTHSSASNNGVSLYW